MWDPRRASVAEVTDAQRIFAPEAFATPVLTRALPDGAKLDRVDQAILGNNIGYHDQLVAGNDTAGTEQDADGVFDRDIGLAGEGHLDGFDGAKEAELAEQLDRRGERKNRRGRWAQSGEACRHKTMTGERDDF